MPSEYIVKTKRTHCLLGLIVGVLLLFLGLDLHFFHLIPGARISPNNVLWIILAGVGLLCLYGSGRRFVWPQTYLSVDDRGITVYSGRTARSWNTKTRSWNITQRAGETQLIPWNQILDIGEGTIGVETRTLGPKVDVLGGQSSLGKGRKHQRTAKALQVLCSPSIRLEGFDIFGISKAWNGLQDADLRQMSKEDRDQLGPEDLNSGFLFHSQYIKGGLQHAISVLSSFTRQ